MTLDVSKVPRKKRGSKYAKYFPAMRELKAKGYSFQEAAEIVAREAREDVNATSLKTSYYTFWRENGKGKKA